MCYNSGMKRVLLLFLLILGFGIFSCSFSDEQYKPSLAVVNYLSDVSKSIKSNWQPIKKDFAYSVVVEFLIDDSGKVSDAYIKKTSGYTDIDYAAIGAVAKYNPQGKVPRALKKHELPPIDIEFTYKPSLY